MNAETHRRATDLLLDALDLPERDRPGFLDTACDTAALRAEVDALLAAHETGGFLDRTASWHPIGADPVEGTQIGPWAVETRIGEGGMGAVYRAHRADGAYERTVALKLLRPGPDAAGLAARLRAERQILAGLEHPHIARLYDGGMTEAGLPYLALEFVDGLAITAYADAHALDVRERLTLALQVCDAVAHAHRHLVVHRDLKPSNILVSERHGGEASAPSVTLLDFGIATLVDETDLHTRTGLRALTPTYAAPEQILGQTVTTATDVYALGVLLYELLVGQRPYDLSGTTSAEAERLICETAPPRPSVVAPEVRARALRGDLDTILLKALAKEPERRYDGAADLATDLRRHLAGHPVVARPATLGYRVRSYVRRHRVGVAAASVVLLALVGGLGASLWQAREAETERRKAQRVTEFLQEMLASANPYGGTAPSLKELMTAATRRASDELADEPELQAAVFHTLGTTYHSLGRIETADSLLRLALDHREALHGPRHPETADTYHALGVLARDLADYSRSDSLLRLALAVRRNVPGSGDVDLGATLLQLGITAQRANDADASEAYLLDAIARRGSSRGTDAGEAAEALGHLYHREGRYAESDSVLRLADGRVVEHLGPLHPRRGSILVNRAWNRYYLGDGDAVKPLLDSSLAIREASLGPDHPDVATTLNDIGWYHGDRGELDLADLFYRRALAVKRAAFGDAHSDVPIALNNIAVNAREMGNYTEATRLSDEALGIMTQQLGTEHPDLANIHNNLARIARDQGDFAEAVRQFQRGLDLRRAGLPEGHVSTGTSLSSLADAYTRWGRPEAALPLAREGAEITIGALGEEHPTAAVARLVLGEALVAAGSFEEAASVLARGQSVWTAANGDEGDVARRFREALARAT